MTDAHSDPDNKGDEPRGSTDDQERTVPLTALTAETGKRQALERQVAELQGQVTEIGRQATEAKTTETRKTPAELHGLVDEGRLTQAQADEIRDSQLRADVQDDTQKAIKDTLSTQNDANTVDTATKRYIAAIPDINKMESPERNKVEQHFSRLTGPGYNMSRNETRTTLLAMEAAFGPIEAVEAAKQRDRQPGHDETGGGEANDAEVVGGGDGWSKDMPARNRQYYQDRINKGIYTEASAAKEWSGRTKRSAA